MRYEIDIMHYLSIYKREWKKIVYWMILAMAITMVISMLKPATYSSTLIALSPKEGSTGGKLESFLGLSMGNSSEDLIFSMLKSRRMSDDINRHFNPDGKRKLSWSIDTYIVTGGFAVEIKGSDPLLTRDIANFAVTNVDKINMELQISPQKPMVKVLDPALKGSPANKNVSKKVMTAALFVFLIYTLFVFFKEYFHQMKASRSK